MSSNEAGECVELNPEFLLNAYSQGYFPMADQDGSIGFYHPDPRAVFPLDKVRPGKHIRKVMRSLNWHVTKDSCFEEVMRACAGREETWINGQMIKSYKKLHEMGAAHSIEVWLEGELVGGLYGVAIGAVFFGESMFNKVDDAAKIAFYSLVERLKDKGFVLLDSQFLNPFTESLGAAEISAEEFRFQLEKAVLLPTEF